MYKDLNQKDNRRKDAIYNPIEGKWERRHNPFEDDDTASKIQDFFHSFTKKPDRLSQIQNTKANLSLKQITYKPLKKLQDIKKQQDLHDQKYSQTNEEDYKKGKEEEKRMLIKIAITVVLILLYSISKL